MATGSGKTTVLAMVIAWQTVNAIHGRRNYSDAFLVVCPGITIRDRLRVLLPSDPENYYESRGLVPDDMIGAIRAARVVVTNYHAFKLRETFPLPKFARAVLQGRGAVGRAILRTPTTPRDRAASSICAPRRTCCGRPEPIVVTSNSWSATANGSSDSARRSRMRLATSCSPMSRTTASVSRYLTPRPAASTYRPDFILRVHDGSGPDDPLHLVVEIKGYRRIDAQNKRQAVETHWVPAVNNHGSFGRWAFLEIGDMHRAEAMIRTFLTRHVARQAAE
jgi:hypothetical protein